MKDSQADKQGAENRVTSDDRAGRRVLSLVVVVLFAFCMLLILFLGRNAAAVTNGDAIARTPEALEAALSNPAQNYGKFSHSYPGVHAALTGRYSCSSCHDRRDNSIEPRFPDHKGCISCHQTQFTTPATPFCSICHTAESLSQQNPPAKKFSGGLSGFRTDFDHEQHATGDGRPQTGCAACHAPARRGIAKTIPARLSAHQTCFQCHTPGRQSSGVDISSCGSCHGPGRYGPTSTAARSFGIGFSHADHGARQRLNCESCHTVGRRGLPQGRQVSSTFPAQHFPNTRAQTCVTCHNGQRTFGETNFNDCKRCHSGTTFRL